MLKKILLALIILGALYLIAILISRFTLNPRKIKPVIVKLSKFTVIGHQGSPKKYPGNTIESFKETLLVNKKAMLEMDLHQTKDKIIVVNHDRAVDTTTNGKGNIDQLTYDYIKKLDAGYKFSPDNGKTYPFRNKGYRIASFEEVLKTFKGIPVSADIKLHTISFSDRVIKVIQKNNAIENVVIGSFSDEVMNHVRNKYPQIATSFSKSEVIKFFILHKLNLIGFFRPKDDIMMIPEFSDDSKPEYLGSKIKQGIRIISQSFIKDADSVNIPVFAWTINKNENMKRLISWKIRGIITDYPEILNNVYKKMEQ